jgi:hypothetical protein
MMRALLFTALFTMTSLPVLAQQKKKAAPPPPPASSDDKSVTTDATGKKSKSYTFTGLDLDGKLKTPQLLYFLNRMKSEFDTTTPSRRSFLPELKRSTDEM